MRIGRIAAATTAAVGCLGGLAVAPAHAQDRAGTGEVLIIDDAFAPVGSATSRVLFDDDACVNADVTAVDVALTVDIDDGDAANFVAQMRLPIVATPGSSPFLEINGAELGWSGTGTFVFHEPSPTDHNGTVRAGSFGAETYPDAYEGNITAPNHIVITCSR